MKKIRFALVSIMLPLFTAAIAGAQNISTIAGCGVGDDSLATNAELFGPQAIAVDNQGNTYIADASSYLIRKVDAGTGVITTIAGNGTYGYSGDGALATSASIGAIYGITTDKYRNVYFVDNINNCVRKISTSGIIATVAGSGFPGFSGDGGPATLAKLSEPTDIVADTIGNLYITDWGNNMVRKVDTAGIISTVVGDGLTHGGTGSGGLATESELGSPFRIAIDKKGNLYVAEVQYLCIVKVDTAGILTILADTTGNYSAGADGDGGSALSAIMTAPFGLAVDTLGNIYFSDANNFRVRRIDGVTDTISTFAASGTPGFSGDGLIATDARIGLPAGLAIDASGNLLICDAGNNRIRKVNTLGLMSTFAGQSGLFGDGHAGINTELGAPSRVAVDAAGNVYISDMANNRIRKLDITTGFISTVAGNGIAGYEYGYSGDGGPAVAARIYGPSGIALDAMGNLYIADEGNSRVRKVDVAGIITTIAGNGTRGYSGDGGIATSAELKDPAGVAVDAAGNIYIADQSNSRIRKVSATTGKISTVAGTGSSGISGDGGLAIHANINLPSDVAVDTSGNIYICDPYSSCIRKVDTNGIITSLTAHGPGSFSGDGAPSTMARLNTPQSVFADKYGDLFIADVANERIRMINKNGIISTIAGNGMPGFSGDGALATSAALNEPLGVTTDEDGNIYIADAGNDRIRKLSYNYLSLSVVSPLVTTVQVYPNPAHDYVFVVTGAPLAGIGQIIISNAVGQEVYRAPLTQGRQAVNIAGFADGVYMLQVTCPNGEKKLMKIVKD